MSVENSSRATDASHSARPWLQHVKSTWSLGVPVVGAQLSQLAINTTDTLMVGQLGALPLAAIVLATQCFFVFFMFGTGFTLAVMPLAAEAVGSDDDLELRRAIRMGIWISLIYALLVMIPLYYLETILLWTGQSPDVASLASDYMKIALWGMIPAMLFAALRSAVTAVELASVLLWATIAGTALNALLDYMLIFGVWGAPRLGVEGAAYASIGSGSLILAIVALYCRFKPRLKDLELYTRLWRADWQKFIEIIRLGLPISITIISEAGLFIAASLIMGWFGTATLAAHGIALQLASITFMIPLGLASVATVRVGNAFGRKNTLDAQRAGSTVLIMALFVATLSAVCFWLFPEFLIALFLDQQKSEAQQIIQIAIPLLAMAAAFQLVDSAQAIAAGNLRGLKDTRLPMIIAIISYWPVGMLVAYLLSQYTTLGGIGVWVGLALGLTVASIALNWRFYRLVGQLHASQLPKPN